MPRKHTSEQRDTDWIIVRMAITGLSYKEISGLMRISHSTVNNRIRHIFDKEGVSSMRELIAVGFRKGKLT
jgi:DNA-binding CsgD family transcriptional regulator